MALNHPQERLRSLCERHRQLHSTCRNPQRPAHISTGPCMATMSTLITTIYWRWMRYLSWSCEEGERLERKMTGSVRPCIRKMRKLEASRRRRKAKARANKRRLLKHQQAISLRRSRFPFRRVSSMRCNRAFHSLPVTRQPTL